MGMGQHDHSSGILYRTLCRLERPLLSRDEGRASGIEIPIKRFLNGAHDPGAQQRFGQVRAAQ